MQENYELVQKGFRILLGTMSGYIGREFNRAYGNDWWREVYETLSDQRDLPINGEYGELLDSLDVANCIRLVDRKWNEIFRNLLKMNCRTWAKELMGYRNIVAHIGQQDLDQPTAERALDTMVLLCSEMDKDDAKMIKEIYLEVRSRSEMNQVAVALESVSQPLFGTESKERLQGSLLDLVDTDLVQKTNQTKKVSYAGKTEIYPVYQVRLDALYYNDQNDRIATWISKYEAENGSDSLSQIGKDVYNRVIEDFIVESNPDAIVRTQNNIEIISQKEPGVTLLDGRIVDGNRRYTCLRRIERKKSEPQYFETVIMDMDIRQDKKQIKLLELSIQHGEESKVAYDLIDYAVGTYRDVVQTNLLTVKEYSESTNEPVAEVNKRIEVAKLTVEFLEYIRLPEQYHVAREYQVYSLLQEMMGPLKKLSEEEQTELKHIVFNNVMLHALPDQRKFIRDIKGLIKSENYQSYFEEQKECCASMEDAFNKADIKNKQDVEQFSKQYTDLVEELKQSMERALQRSRLSQLQAKPIDNVNKCIELVMEIDTRIVQNLDEEDKELLKAKLSELEIIAGKFKNKIN